MNRTFTIIDSDTQRTAVIQSTAETVAELKRDLEANGFVVEGKSIQEGISRTEFTSDESVLPHDVPRNGTTTNDLVFRLTKSNKNIKSGVLTRQEAYAKVKELGLGETIKSKFGKNFTQCSTETLVKEIESVIGTGNTDTTADEDALARIEEKLNKLITILVKGNYKEEKCTHEEKKPCGAIASPYTPEELESMFEGL